jgi:hypothetical protein
MKSHSSLFCIALWSILASRANADPKQPRPSRVIERFDVSGKALLIPVAIDGQRPASTFLVDTGASMTVFDTSLKRLLISRNSTEKASTPHGSIEVEMCEPPRLQLGRYEVRMDEPVACTNLAALANITRDEVVGIIGMDLLSKQIVHLDFDEGSLSFLKSVPDTWEMLLPIDGTARGPMAHVGIPTGSLLCQIDTGCLGVAALNHGVFDALESHDLILPLGKSYGIDLCRTAEQRTALLPPIGFGNFRTPPAVVGELDGPNLLGLHFWSRFNVTFDFPKRALYLQRNSNFDLTEGSDRSGLHLFRRRGEFIVDRIDPRSPAELSGVQPYDRLLSVDSQSAEVLSLASMRKLLCRSRKKVDIKLRRGERKIAIALQLSGDPQGPRTLPGKTPQWLAGKTMGREE